MAESAEGARLLSECRVKSSTEGSNPSLSAISYTQRGLSGPRFCLLPAQAALACLPCLLILRRYSAYASASLPGSRWRPEPQSDSDARFGRGGLSPAGIKFALITLRKIRAGFSFSTGPGKAPSRSSPFNPCASANLCRHAHCQSSPGQFVIRFPSQSA
jgi:hypothetical protein